MKMIENTDKLGQNELFTRPETIVISPSSITLNALQTANKHAMWGIPSLPDPKHEAVECFCVVSDGWSAQGATILESDQTFLNWKNSLPKATAV